MPKQGQSVESCILTEMKKKKGDTVAVGDILFSYETDKASFEEEAKVAGTVLDVFFDDGDEIPVLTNVMVIGNEGESTEEFRPGAENGASATATPEDAPAAAPAQPLLKQLHPLQNLPPLKEVLQYLLVHVYWQLKRRSTHQHCRDLDLTAA